MVPRLPVYALLLAGFVFFAALYSTPPHTFLTAGYGALRDLFVTAPEPARVLFVGDVMLAREVERYGRTYGPDHHFALFAVLPRFDAVVGNFEATVPATHVPTPNFAFRFSVPTTSLPALRAAGFTHVSLANNHSGDFGVPGLAHTRRALASADIIPFGQPDGIASTSVAYLTTPAATVAVIGLHTLTAPLDQLALEALIRDASAVSAHQIAFIHWGEEYAPTHDEVQAALARTLIDAGVDAVIGHHPHVVQDIEVYAGKPIFYSLGNFIFDQYFSQEVQEGLMVELTVTNATLTYRLLPVSSLNSRTQPHLMAPAAAAAYLEALADRSQLSSADRTLLGLPATSNLLATSTEQAMMAP